MNVVTCRIKDYIQPFERELAFREMQALCAGPLRPINGTRSSATLFDIHCTQTPISLGERLTYWHSLCASDQPITLQVRREASAILAPFSDPYDLPSQPLKSCLTRPHRRRVLRYATHGLHEYRGKFFPQLARALITISRVPADGIVADPMCGSGTTLVEGILGGRSTYGIDLNPLSAFVSRVKCQTLSLSPIQLRDGYDALRSFLDVPSAHRSQLRSLPKRDQEYLVRWFSPVVLRELDRVHAAIGSLKHSFVREFFLVCLSNVLRSVSWQKTDDLRVRKQHQCFTHGEVMHRFLTHSRRSVATVENFLTVEQPTALGNFEVSNADARIASSVFGSIAGRTDAIVTSPPYATALPYLDTDRLSLIYLNLLQRCDHASRDRVMIGSREIGVRTRAEYWDIYQANRSLLPLDTCQLIERVEELNRTASVGFRRKNLAALLSKYFLDMRTVLTSARTLLRPGGVAFIVIGDNRTIAGGQIIQIRTAEHLAAISEAIGFTVLDELSMEMLPSRDIFRKNSIVSERVLQLRAP